MTSSWTIDEIGIPAAVDDPAMDDVRGFVAVRNGVEDAWIGGGVFDVTLDEFLSSLRDTRERQRRLFAGRIDGAIVGQVLLTWAAAVPTTLGWINGGVLPAWRNRGLGTALLERAEAAAAAEGLRTFQIAATHPQQPGPERVIAATGFGSVPAGDPGVRLLKGHGYRLEQIQRISFLDLPVDPARLATWRAEAEAVAGPDYRAHAWTSPSPERWLDDLATLHARIATDAPAGDLEIVDHGWDAARIRAQEARAHRAGRLHVVATVEHVPTGSLVAINGLSLAGDQTRPVRQGPTLVLKGHRGHRLGMLVKTVNLQQLARISPGSPMVMTDNAEENRPMLAINEALGFRAVGYDGIWKKTIA